MKPHSDFISGLSTVTRLVETLHDLALKINEPSQTVVIFIDFTKAFDHVSHAELLFKLHNFLRDGPVLHRMRSYLTDQHQFVQCGHHHYDLVLVLPGFPQGSVLAPSLFLIFSDNLAYQVDAPIRLFSDDCIPYNHVQHTEHQLNLNILFKKIAQWCDVWQIPTEPTKLIACAIQT